MRSEGTKRYGQSCPAKVDCVHISPEPNNSKLMRLVISRRSPQMGAASKVADDQAKRPSTGHIALGFWSAIEDVLIYASGITPTDPIIRSGITRRGASRDQAAAVPSRPHSVAASPVAAQV